MGRLDGKLALITGSTAGMGAAMAEIFSRQGARVAVTGRNQTAGAAVVDRITSAGGEALYLPLDVGDPASVRTAFASAAAELGGLDVLVNNAAATDAVISGLDGACADVTPEGFDRIVKVGLYGPFWCTQHAIRLMRDRGGGSIINIASAAAVEGVPRTLAYTCSKGALSAMTRQLAVDYGADGIRVNTITAGFIITSELAQMMSAHPAFGAVRVTPRFGEPADVANCAVYLASDEAAFVTGAAFAVDGGLTAKSAFPDPMALLTAVNATDGRE